jgi:DNA polymerase III delta prime subunit
MIWDDYRPDTWNEVVGMESLISKLKTWIDEDSLPHLLFFGPPGTGKSAIARLIRRYYLNDAARFKLDYMELNGSKDRGIDVIRDLGEKLQMGSFSGRKKLVVIDEAEQLTPDAWKALKKILENVSKTAIFVFLTNNISKIPDAIVSRCFASEFLPHTEEESKVIVSRVESKLKTTFNPKTVDVAIEKSGGDLRKLLGTYLIQMIANPNASPEDLVKDNSKVIDKIKEILAGLKEKKPGEAVKTLVDTMRALRKKMSPNEILSTITEASNDVNVAEKCGWTSLFISVGVPEEIALLSFAATVVISCQK